MDRPDAQLVRAALTQVGFSRRGDDYFAALIMSDLLAESCVGIAAASPVAKVEVEHDARQLAGPLTVEIKCSPTDFPGVLDSVQTVMIRLQTTPPAAEQVESAKSRLITAMAEKLKGNDGASQVLLDIETYGLGRDYLINFAERVSAITPAAVQQAAQSYLKPQSAVVVIAGPASKLEGAVKPLGAVTVSK
jgi:predicted Zn-dependent peptidase